MMHKKSLLYPILIMLALTALATLASGFYLNYQPAHKNAHERIQQQVLQTLDQVQSQIEEETLRLPRLLRLLQSNRILQGALQRHRQTPLTNDDAFRATLQQLTGDMGIELVALVDGHGEVILNASPNAEQLSQRMPKPETIEHGKSVLFSLPTDQGLELWAAAPVFNNGRLVGGVVVGSRVGSRWLQGIARHVHHELTLTDAEKILASSSGAVPRLALDLDQSRQAIASEGIITAEDHGHSLAHYYAPLKVMGAIYVLIAHIELAASHGFLFQSASQLAWSAGVILLLVLGLAAASYWYLIHPLRRLQNKSQILMDVCATGLDRETPAAEESGNELKVLDRAFETASMTVYTHIGKLHEQKDAMERLACSDALTGLGNRRLFHDFLGRSLAQGRRQKGRVAILFMDLDKFKPVNDTLGHDMGDLLLTQVSKRLEHCVRDSDAVFRMGGDEFAAILPECQSAEQTLAVARRLIQETEKPFELREHVCRIGVSIGISIFPDQGEDAETLLKKADMALYQVKEEGRGQCRIYGALGEATASPEAGKAAPPVESSGEVT
ncbi:MAG: GGDEF domain-containing protein [Magnetococcales bacterium]|nr:GGDEF domain-containing protein [Magnetococcales bacterium]